VGSSFTEFRNYGFWSRDPLIEEWLGELASECRKHLSSEPWLAELCAHWELQATGAFNGWVHANLDEFLTSQERLSFIISVSERVKDTLSADQSLSRTGDLFIRLLKGELNTDASSPLDYIVL
jgi:hypothetical protein